MGEMDIETFTRRCEELHKIFLGAQDVFVQSLQNDNNKGDFGEIKCKSELGRIKDEIELIIDEQDNIYFNELELRIRYPPNSNYDKLFESIRLEIGGQWIHMVYNAKSIDIYNKFLKNNKKIRFDGEYMYIPLPFLNYNNFLYKLYYHKLKIICRFNENVNKVNVTLYGNKYNFNTNENITQTLYTCATSGIEKCNSEDNISKLQLAFNHPTSLLTVLDENGNPLENVEKFVLKLNQYSIEITPGNLIDINKRLGYSFDFPVFIFDPTINLTMVDSGLLEIHWAEKCIPKKGLVLYNIHKNILVIGNGMGGLRFSK